MLTDEELAELEAAVVMFDGPLSSIAALGISTMVEFTREQIARERIMRQPLTAEICERLGLKEFEKVGTEVLVDATFITSSINVGMNGKLRWSTESVSDEVTVSHLFAAAKLAGVTLDWRKVGE